LTGPDEPTRSPPPIDGDSRRSQAEGQRKVGPLAAPDAGDSLDSSDGRAGTRIPLRLPMKVLKGDGLLQPEVEALQRMAALRAAAARAETANEAQALRRQANALQLGLALRQHTQRSDPP
jgi:hypothetical protein